VPRSPWSARGSPLVRRASPPRALASAVAPGSEPSRTVSHVATLVRECLLDPPQPASLHVARPGQPLGRQLRRARAEHRLEPWEELIAAWRWAPVLSTISRAPASLIFTGVGVAIAEPRLRLAIRYDAFADYAFSYEFTPGGRTGPDLCELVIVGPTPWRSPNANQSAELIAADLTRIRQLVTA
jgi:hypothetical protein